MQLRSRETFARLERASHSEETVYADVPRAYWSKGCHQCVIMRLNAMMRLGMRVL